MRLCRVFPTFQTEFQYYEHYLSKELQKRGVRTTFITSDRIEPAWENFLRDRTAFKTGYAEYADFDVYRVKCISILGKPIPIRLSRLKRILRSGNFDVYHFSGIGSFFNFVVLRMIGRVGHHHSVFISDHSNPSEANTTLIGRAYYRLLAFLFGFFRDRIRRVFVPNQGSERLIKARYGLDASQVKIIPLGYDADTFRYIPGVRDPDGDLVIGFAGKINARKSIEKLLRAVAALPTLRIRVLVVGAAQNDPYVEKLMTYVAGHRLNVEFRPLISSPRDLAEFYNYIDLAVFPGSISITTLEATACGTPVIIYRSMEGLENRVADGRGHLFSTEEELIRLIESYDGVVTDRQRIAQNSRSFSWTRISARYFEEYVGAGVG